MVIKNTQDAAAIIDAAVISHEDQWERIANSESYLMDYKPPFEEADREEQMIKWANNWNYGKGRMIIEKGVISNVVEMFRSLSLMEVEFSRNKSEDPIYQFLSTDFLRYSIGRKIAEIFADILEDDVRFHTFLTKIEYNSFTFGYCPIVRDKFIYLGSAASLKCVAFEDRTTLEQIRNWVVFDFIKAEMLLEKIKQNVNYSTTLVQPTRGKEYNIYENGWIKEGIEEIFFNALKQNDQVRDAVRNGDLTLTQMLKDDEGDLQIVTWDDVNLIRDHFGDTWTALNINNINIAKIFTTDANGEITETYIALSSYSEGYASVGTHQYLLYQKNKGKIPYTDLINIVKEFAIGSDDYIQSLKGVSKQVTQDSLIYDFKKNAIEDKLMLNGNLVLQEVEDLSGEQVKIKVYGGMTILPPNAIIAPNQIKQDIGEHVNSIRNDDFDFNNQISHYNPRINLSNRPTKDEVQLRGQEHSSQRSAKSPSKLRDYSVLFTNIFKDLINEEFENPIDKAAKDKFFEELTESLSEFGIEDKEDVRKILEEVKFIKLNAVNNDTAAIQTAMPFAQNSNGRTRLIRSFLISLGFSRQDVNMFVESVEYGYQVEQAANENASFYNTSEVVFDSSQDNVGHLNIHFPKIDRMIKGIQGGEDIVAGFNYITNALTNTEKHVEAIRTSYFFKNRYKEFSDIQNYFTKTAKQIADMINKKKQENAANPQGGNNMAIPPEELRKIELLEWKAQKKEERTNFLTAAAAQRKMAEFQQKMEMKKQDGDTNKKIKEELASLQMELEQLKAATKLAKT
jgi:hypothetical protein